MNNKDSKKKVDIVPKYPASERQGYPHKSIEWGEVTGRALTLHGWKLTCEDWQKSPV